MVKKTITYTSPFTEQEVTEDHYFHMSKADLVEMEVEEHGESYTAKNGKNYTGMQARLQRIVESENGRDILKEFKAILRRAYGKKVGERLVKSAEVWEEFESSEAYSELVFDLLTDVDKLTEFINGIIPNNLEQIASEVSERAKAQAEPNGDPTGLTETTTPRVLTISEAQAMGSEELQAGLNDGRYKLS